MKSNLRFRLSSIIGLLAVVGLAAATTSAKQDREPSGFPEDWSHRHLIFSVPESFAQLTSGAGATQEQWDRFYKAQNDPRYLVQLKKREREQALLAESAGLSGNTAANWIAERAAGEREYQATISGNENMSAKKPKKGPPPAEGEGEKIPRDWSNVMGGGTGTAALGSGRTRVYPAKYSFTTSTKDCTSDFVVYTTNAAGATSSGTRYQTTGTFTAAATAGETVTITNVLYTPSLALTLTAHASTDTGLNFAVGTSASTAATNLANAINRNGGSVGVTASAAGAVVTMNSMTANVQASGITPTETSTTFSWGSETNGSANPGQPTIFALNNLYKDTVANGGCQTSTQAVPATYWSYNTGVGATADLSPVISFYDGGKQIAFIQKTSSQASLVLLKWTANTGTMGIPVAPTSVTPANYRACSAISTPCMTAIALNGNPNVTNSSPFVDYGNDILYVGDDVGKVHKFTGVFQGTPGEVTTTWPVQVASVTSIMSSPVFDFAAGFVFVGSNGPVDPTQGNKLHKINASTGAVTSSGTIGSISTTTGVRDSPIVDSSLGRVFAFQGAFTTASNDTLGNSCGGTCNAVFQFATGFAASSTGDRVVYVGLGGTNSDLNRAMNSGAFDDAYYTSSGTGNMYVCGSQTGAARRATIWKIGMTSGDMTSRTEGPLLVNGDSNDGCAPVTVFKNGSDEFLFASVNNNANASGGTACTAASCVYSYNLTALAGTAYSTTSAKSKIDSATTRYMSVSSAVALNTTEGSVQTTVTAATAGTYQGMTITQGANSPSSTSFTYTLRKGGVSQSITCTVATGTSTCSDPTNSVVIANGDLIDVMVTRTGTGTLETTFSVTLSATGLGFSSSINVTAALDAVGGTGGIIIDNTASGGGSQIYYANRTSPGTAVQATQKALK